MHFFHLAELHPFMIHQKRSKWTIFLSFVSHSSKLLKLRRGDLREHDDYISPGMNCMVSHEGLGPPETTGTWYLEGPMKIFLGGIDERLWVIMGCCQLPLAKNWIIRNEGKSSQSWIKWRQGGILERKVGFWYWKDYRLKWRKSSSCMSWNKDNHSLTPKGTYWGWACPMCLFRTPPSNECNSIWTLTRYPTNSDISYLGLASNLIG